MKLYELTEQWAAVLALLEEDADPEAVRDTLEGIEGEIEDKADGYAKLIKQLEGEAEIIKAEKERLYQRETSLKNKAKDMKARLEEAMVQTGKKKFKTELFSFGIQKNAPSVAVEDETRLLEWVGRYKPDFIRTKKELDKKAILDALKSGEEIKYARLQQSESLRIR